MNAPPLLRTAAICCIAMPCFSKAQWNSDPAANTPIAVRANDQSDPRIIDDNAGGALIVWNDTRSECNGRGIYAQRINADGLPLWETNGKPLVTQPTGEKQLQDVVSDGNGGAIAIYLRTDNLGNHDILAQRIDANGTTLWNAAGANVCVDNFQQLEPVAVSDGNGGLIIAWWDMRNDEGDIFAQHLDANGIALWATNGIGVATGDGGQTGVRIASNGTGGALIAWYGGFFGAVPGGVRIQNVSANGTLLWGGTGVRLCPLNSPQAMVELCATGTGGALVTWDDRRNDALGDLYAQHVNAGGALQWDTLGVLLDDGVGQQGAVAMARAGTTGTYIAWDTPPDSVNMDNNIRAQFLDDAGTAHWDALGSLVCGAPLYQDFPKLVVDPDGNAIIAWLDARNGTSNDLYMQRISPLGAAQWALDGVPLANGSMNDHWWNAPGTALNKQLLAMDNGTVAVWNKIPLTAFEGDIYASMMGPDGTLSATGIGERQTFLPYSIFTAADGLKIHTDAGSITDLTVTDLLGRISFLPHATGRDVTLPDGGTMQPLFVRFAINGRYYTEAVLTAIR